MDVLLIREECDSGLDNIEKSWDPDVMDGPEHDGKSGLEVESSIFPYVLYHVGSHMPAYP